MGIQTHNILNKWPVSQHFQEILLKTNYQLNHVLANKRRGAWHSRSVRTVHPVVLGSIPCISIILQSFDLAEFIDGKCIAYTVDSTRYNAW